MRINPRALQVLARILLAVSIILLSSMLMGGMLQNRVMPIQGNSYTAFAPGLAPRATPAPGRDARSWGAHRDSRLTGE
jgi:hypothetical protein